MYAPIDPMYSHVITNGETTIPRANLSAGTALVSGNLYLTYFTALKTQNVNTVTVYSGGSSSSGTTLCQIGVYGLDYTVTAAGTTFPWFFASNLGDLSLLTWTTNDTSLLSSSNTAYTRSLSATWYKERGMRYAIGILWIGTSGPVVVGQSTLNSAITGQILTRDPILAHVVTGQTILCPQLTRASRTTFSGAGNTTAASTTISLSLSSGQTDATGAFSPNDVGLPISGTNIPGGATVTAWNSFTSATISQAATTTGSGITFTIGPAAYSTTTQPKVNYVELTS